MDSACVRGSGIRDLSSDCETAMVGRYIRARGRRIRVEVEGWGRVLHVIVGPWRWKVEAGLLSES
jgi:hypothetical protein